MRPPHNGYVWNRGAAQGWWHGLIIAGETRSDPPERVVPTFILHGRDISGDQYAVQSKGSLMARKLPDKVWGKNNAEIPMGVYISSGLRPHVEHEGDFIYINSPRCWVVVRAVGTKLALSNETLSAKQGRGGDFYRLVNDHRPVILEVAAPGDYGSFDEFRQAAVSAELSSRGGRHAYQALAGDRLAMFDARSRPTINGRPINYNPGVVYDSRYIHSEWDSGVVTIKVGDVEAVLDFMSD